MCSALADRKLLNLCAADGAGLSFAAIDAEIILKLTAAIDPVYAGAVAADTVL
jgi:hypothetical protein